MHHATASQVLKVALNASGAKTESGYPMTTKRKRFPTLHSTFEPWKPKIKILEMDVVEITPEQRKLLNDVCLGIFADMTNAGAPLQDILAACYMTGMQHTLSMREASICTGKTKKQRSLTERLPGRHN